MALTDEQLDVLRMNLNSRRVATRRDGGKNLSYLEAWDIKAHLIRVFGYGNFDATVHDVRLLFERTYNRSSDDAEMIEVCFSAMCTLVIRDKTGQQICTYTEGACGQANVQAANATRGDAYDNALKQAESDALKRCAINLGTQFGLSLYNDGSRADVIRWTIEPKWPTTELTDDQRQALETSVGATDNPGEGEGGS